MALLNSGSVMQIMLAVIIMMAVTLFLIILPTEKRHFFLSSM